MKKYLKKFRDFLDKHELLPSFTSDTVFLMVVALVIICFIDIEAREDLSKILVRSRKATIIVLIGAVFTVYTTFFVRFKTEVQKHYMLWFALIINFVVSLAVFFEVSAQQAFFVWYIFPLLNITTFIIVIVFWYVGLYDLGRLETKSSSYSNVIYGVVFLILALLFYRYAVVDASWEYVFSGAVIYASLFNKKVVKYLPNFSFGDENKVDVIESLIDESAKYSLSLINSVGLKASQLIVVTSSKKEVIDVPKEELGRIDEYIGDLVGKRYQNNDVSVVVLGEYERKTARWRRKEKHLCLIIDVFLREEKKKHEFFWLLKEEKKRFYVSDKGFTFQKSYDK